MKKVILFSAVALALTACNDSNEPKKVEVDSAVIDYTAENAQAWGNYMVQVGSLLKDDAQKLMDH